MKYWIIVNILWILSLSLLVLVDSKAKISLRITKFHTYTNRRLDRKCCGDFDGTEQVTQCSRPCLSKFKICLEAYHVPIADTDQKPYIGPCVHGVREPLSLELINGHVYTYNIDIQKSWPVYVNMIIEVYDATNRDSYNDAVVDRFVYKNALKPTIDGELDKMWHNVTLVNGAAHCEFSVKLVCQKYYHGDSCDKYCKNNIVNQINHYKCDENGNKICHDGWMGPNCNISICKRGCHSVHGFCNKPGECLCTEGWKGPYCDECIKYPGCVHGTCVDSPWTCYCQPNWGGYFCDKSLNYCGENNPCKNGGICENQPSKIDPYKCTCASGFEGKNCEIDHCSPNPCKKGTCLKSSNGVYCQCFPGSSGKLCELDQIFCELSTCKNGGTCRNDDNGLPKCVCPTGFQGHDCQQSVQCDNTDCKNAKECQLRPNDNREYDCVCLEGWRGRYCDEDINECERNPCKNGAICKNSKGSYKCHCNENFRGINCDVNIACDSNPCKNGGVCQETATGFVCKCRTDYSGKFCETYKTGCSPNPCRNGAYCYTVDKNYYCQCGSDFWGQHCEHPRPYCGRQSCAVAYDACSMPMNKSYGGKPICGQYGTCVSRGSKEFQCQCMPGFEGQYCERNVDDCLSSPCQNNGICVDKVNDFECFCNSGFRGKRCEERIDFCLKNPCLNGGQCKSRLTESSIDVVCECTSIWGGKFCHVASSSACDENPCMHGGVCSVDVYGSGSFKCDCQPGWVGLVCQIRGEQSQPCYRNPCRNNGVCLSFGDVDYTCQCLDGYEGRNCETDSNECLPNPCFNGGKCLDLINSYKCECPKGFYGSQCQSNFDECIANPCTFGSVCIDRVDGFECRCPEGRSGILCDQIINNNRAPQPPSCVYHNRTFDSGQHWSYNCENCRCDTGKSICKKAKCGTWSCLKSHGPDDPYACKHDEVCHPFPFDGSRCFIPPCSQRAQCLKQQHSEVPSNTVQWPGDSTKQCRPNGNHKNNNCAQILLKFEKRNMPVGVTVDDICLALKTLPVISSYKDTPQGESLGVSCDVNDGNPSIINVAIFSLSNNMMMLKSTNTRRPFVHFLCDKMADNLIEVVRQNYSILSGLVDIKVETLLLQSDMTDQSNLLKYMLIPLVLFAVFIIVIIIWHHRRKMTEIREDLLAKPSFNNNHSQFQAVPPYPNITNGPILSKYIAFDGGKIRTQNIPSDWSHGRHQFNG